MDNQTEIETLATTGFNAVVNEMGGSPSLFANLPDELKTAWYMVIIQTQIWSEFPQVVEPIPQGEHSCTCGWGVSAGLIPGEPMPEFSKEWAMTSEERESEHGQDIFTWRMFAAIHYLEQLQNPKQFNWAQLQWIWY